MIMSAEAPSALSKEDAQALLEDTARSVKIMKASWLRVALNLQKIRQHEVWRHDSRCESFDGYVFGVLDIPRGVARRMLAAVDYTNDRRPEFIQDFDSGRDDIHVPSYDTLNHLRRAEDSFSEAGREDEFKDMEARVFDGEIGRVSLKKEIDERLGVVREDNSGDETRHEEPDRPLDLGAVLDELKGIEKKLLKLDVSKEARQLMFQLVETLQKERTGRAAKA